VEWVALADLECWVDREPPAATAATAEMLRCLLTAVMVGMAVTAEPMV
jgi:hypothetical protein